eukprot:SAG31_NODE_2144_length_6341_cov_59.535085_6_plen_88_part_00
MRDASMTWMVVENLGLGTDVRLDPHRIAPNVRRMFAEYAIRRTFVIYLFNNKWCPTATFTLFRGINGASMVEKLGVLQLWAFLKTQM